MAERMNKNLVFDHTDARRDLDSFPRSFRLTRKDLPRWCGGLSSRATFHRITLHQFHPPAEDMEWHFSLLRHSLSR